MSRMKIDFSIWVPFLQAGGKAISWVGNSSKRPTVSRVGFAAIWQQRYHINLILGESHKHSRYFSHRFNAQLLVWMEVQRCSNHHEQGWNTDSTPPVYFFFALVGFNYSRPGRLARSTRTDLLQLGILRSAGPASRSVPF